MFVILTKEVSTLAVFLLVAVIAKGNIENC